MLVISDYKLLGIRNLSNTQVQISVSFQSSYLTPGKLLTVRYKVNPLDPPASVLNYL